MKTALVILIFVCVPLTASAKVVVSEFMYDALDTDTDKEYVELFNDGTNPVDLTKWKINDGSNHTLNVPPKNGGTGSITIPAQGYVVLVNDASVFVGANPSISVSIIDTVLSLGNTSGVIQVLNESGIVEDSVTYAKANGAAGTGDTLHWNGSAYVPGAPTPGGAFAGGTVAEPEKETTTTSQTSSPQNTASSPPVSSFVAPITPSIFAYAGKDRDVIAGADVVFEGSAYDKHGDAIDATDKVRFLWTFGDGGTAEGVRVTHRYAQPGKYAAVLDIAQVLSAASAQVIVTAHPVSIGVTIVNGAIVLTNTSGRDLDISGWHLRAGSGTFTLPARTILLRDAAVPFSPDITRVAASRDATLLYPNGIEAAHAGDEVIQGEVKTATPSEEAVAETSKRVESEVETEKQHAEVRAPEEKTTEDINVVASTSALVAAAAYTGGDSTVWQASLGALVLVGAVGTALARRLKKQEWDIEEITDSE